MENRLSVCHCGYGYDLESVDDMNGSRAVVELLEEQDTDIVFGIPGGVLLPLYDELVSSKLRHILPRHEQCAAHMADGYARVSKRPGICIAT